MSICCVEIFFMCFLLYIVSAQNKHITYSGSGAAALGLVRRGGLFGLHKVIEGWVTRTTVCPTSSYLTRVKGSWAKWSNSERPLAPVCLQSTISTCLHSLSSLRVINATSCFGSLLLLASRWSRRCINVVFDPDL